MEQFLDTNYVLVAALAVIALWVAIVKFGPMRRL